MRPWYALHWLTCLLLAIVLVDIAWAQDYPDTIVARDGVSFHFGWPCLHSTTHSALVAATRGRPWVGLALAANYTAWTVLLLSVGSACESWRQPSGRWFSISVRQLLGIVTALAVVLAWRGGQTPLLTLPIANLGTVELNTGFRSWPLLSQLPLLFAIACAVYAAGEMTWRLGHWSGARLARLGGGSRG